MHAEIITIGNELLQGKILNSNATTIARSLSELGIWVERITSVSDDSTAITAALKEAAKKSQIVILTGGLGPTKDDITKDVICSYYKIRMVRDKRIAENIIARLKKLGYKTIPKRVLTQADVPKNSIIFPNPVGGAPGILLKRRNLNLFLLPGVPAEMEAILFESVSPYLKELKKEHIYSSRTIRTTSIGETVLAELIEPVVKRWKNPTISYLPGVYGVDLRFTLKGKSVKSVEQKLEESVKKVLPLISNYVYGFEDDDVEKIVADLMIQKQLTIAVTESCTGGIIAHRLTNVSGSSNYFERGVVAYANYAKSDLLGVSPEMLNEYGAVSMQVAKAMAEGIRRLAGTDIGLSSTGIMGPTGGTPQKPVGLVYIGYNDKNGAIAKKFNFGNNRLQNKTRASQAALNLLRQKLQKNF